jgi:alpha-glucosidase
MRNKLAVIIVLLCAMPGLLAAQKSAKVTSPDGRLVIDVVLTANAPVYTVNFKKQPVIKASYARF